MPWATLRPSPVPCGPLVVKNGSKAWRRTSSLMPRPVSVIAQYRGLAGHARDLAQLEGHLERDGVPLRLVAPARARELDHLAHDLVEIHGGVLGHRLHCGEAEHAPHHVRGVER